MFCDEPIRFVYESAWDGTDEEHVEAKELPYADDSVCFSCYYPEPACYIVSPSRLVLETESYYIQVEPSGVSKIKKDGPVTSLERPNEWLRSFLDNTNFETDELPFDQYPHTLLVGERLQRVYKEGYFLMLQFDHFTLRIINSPSVDYNIYQAKQKKLLYYPVAGCERLLQYRCACGGEPEILKDFTNDYLIRCKKCKNATNASMTVQDAICDWNRQWETNKPDMHPLTLPFDNFEQTFGDKILSISVNAETSWWIEPWSCDCENILIQTEKQEILLEQAHQGDDDIIYFGNPHGLDKEHFTLKILPDDNTPIVYEQSLYLENGTVEGLCFRFGDSRLFVFGGEHELVLTKGTVEDDVFECWTRNDFILFNSTDTA